MLSQCCFAAVVPVMENGGKTKGQGPRRPPAPVANRKPLSAAAAKRPPSQPRAAGGNNNRRPEKPAPAPKTDAQIKEVCLSFRRLVSNLEPRSQKLKIFELSVSSVQSSSSAYQALFALHCSQGTLPKTVGC